MLKRLFLRCLRASVSTILGGALAQVQDNPVYLALTPALMTAGKALRERYPRLGPWLPF